VAWGGLERAAFEDFPDVVAQLRGAAVARRSRRSALYLIPLALLIAVIYAAPIWGLVTVVGPWAFSQTGRTAQGDITAAGIIFIGALVALLVHLVVWFASGRPARTALLGSAVMSLVLGGLSAGAAAVRGIDKTVPDWGIWALPMLTSAVVGLVVIVLVLNARRRAPRESAVPSGASELWQSPEYIAAVREKVGRIGTDDQRAIRADLSEAIDYLRQRGAISPAEAAAAHAAKLGELGGAMASVRTSDAS
jgi:hypothetical protein